MISLTDRLYLKNQLKKDKLKNFEFWKNYVEKNQWNHEEFLDGIARDLNALLDAGFKPEQIEVIREIKNPELYDKPLNSKTITIFLQEMDQTLKKGGFGKLTVVLIGGSVMSFIQKRRLTKDIDFIIPLAQIHSWFGWLPFFRQHMKKEKLIQIFTSIPLSYVLRIDVFLSRELPSVNLMEFKRANDRELNKMKSGHHINLPRFKKLRVRFLHPVDLLCAKIFAGRNRDLKDCEILVEVFAEALTKEQIYARMFELDENKTKRHKYTKILNALFD